MTTQKGRTASAEPVRNEAAERLLLLIQAEHGYDFTDAVAEHDREVRRAAWEAFYNGALGLSWDDDHGNRVVALDGLALIREDVAP